MSDYFNLESTSILILDADEVGLGIMAQILSGFGARKLDRCHKIQEAIECINITAYDLIVVDVTLLRDEAFGFIADIRSDPVGKNRFTTIMVTTGHATDQRVSKARDTGANFIFAKPLRPDVVLKRIQWLSEDRRNFVECEAYNGPDRRHRFEGPPAGMDGRRAEDKDTALGDATEQLFQEDIDRLMQPRKIEL